MNKILLLFTTLTIILMSACTTNETNKEKESKTEQDQIVPFQSFIETNEQPGGIISVSYRVINISNKEQKLTFTSGLQADAILYDKSGAKLAQYSNNVMSTQAMKEQVLKPNEFIEQQFIFEDISNGDYVVEAFLTAKEQQANTQMDITVQENTVKLGSETIKLTKSVLEVDQTLVDTLEKFKVSYDPTILANLEPFQAFQLYMYVKAGQDFKTLYYLHSADPDQVPVDTFVKESMDKTNVQNNDAFMRKLNELREFYVVKTEIDCAYVEFTLPGESEVLQFKLQQNKNKIWQADWMPLQ